jgi:putative tricarboxylic transport membrane protein
MSVSRRPVVRPVCHAAIAAVALALAAGPAAAQTARAPVGPIEITAGSSPGGTAQNLLRRAAQIWNETGMIANPIVIQSRVGGAWAVAIKFVMDRPGDENTVLSLAEPVISTPIVQGTEPVYDKLTPLGVFAQTELVVLAQPNHKANNLKELQALVLAQPQAVKVAGSSAGSTDDQVTGMLGNAFNGKLTFIPHTSGGAATATFLGGNTDLIVLTLGEALPQMEGGKAKPLAVLNETRRPETAFKDIPTAKEQSYDIVWGQMFGLAGTPKLDPAVQKWWDEKIAALVANPDWQKAVRENFMGGTHVRVDGMPSYMQGLQDSRLKILRQLGVSKL